MIQMDHRFGLVDSLLGFWKYTYLTDDDLINL